MVLRVISIVIALIAFVTYSSLFVVDERQKALVLQFGQVADVKEEPGLAFKLPFIQQVVRYDDRILSLDTMPLEVTPLDDRRLVVDAFARYRIINVVQFRQAVGTGGIVTAESRLERILNAALREVELNELIFLHRIWRLLLEECRQREKEWQQTRELEVKKPLK